MSGSPENAPHEAREARHRRAEARRNQDVDRERRGRNAPWRKRIRSFRRRVGKLLTRLLLPSLLRLLAWSWKVERIHYERFSELFDGDGFLIALWHGEMLAPLPLHRKQPVSVLVSHSRDGSLATILLERYGYEVVRGSNSRGSARALRELRIHLERKRGVTITPDGPRGPRHQMNLGPAWLARETGCPIIPLRVVCERAWRLKSWDRFLVPKPFARVTVHYGEPIHVPPDADEADLERYAEDLRLAMLGEDPAESAPTPNGSSTVSESHPGAAGEPDSKDSVA